MRDIYEIKTMTKEEYKEKVLSFKKNKALGNFLAFMFLFTLLGFALTVILPSRIKPWSLILTVISLNTGIISFCLHGLYYTFLAYKGEYIEYTVGRHNYRRKKVATGKKAKLIAIQLLFGISIILIIPLLFLFLLILTLVLK